LLDKRLDDLPNVVKHRFGDVPLLGKHITVSIRGFDENGRYVMLRQHIKHATSAEQASVTASDALQ
jgi:hypothetical protein